MNNQLNKGSTGAFNAGMSLQLLVNRLVSSSLATALRNKVSFVNEVPRDLNMFADESKVIPVIFELLTTVVANARNSQIYISADRYRDILILNIQDRNNNNGYALAFSIQSIEPRASMIGGHISIDGPQQRVATISFSFPNHAAVSDYCRQSGEFTVLQKKYG